MANPQKENGYTPIANEIIEQLVKVPLLGAELRILIFIIRKTYGFHKKKDIISLSQFQSGTGISRPTVVKTLKNLMSRNMIVKVCLPDEGIEYSFVKDHEKWVVNTAKLVKNNSFTSKDRLTETSKHRLTHKRNKYNTKEILAEQSSDNRIPIIINLFGEVNPSYQKLFGNVSQRKSVIRLLDIHGEEKLTKVIKFLKKTNSMPYFPSITTPCQLEDKWGVLESQILKKKNELQVKKEPIWI